MYAFGQNDQRTTRHLPLKPAAEFNNCHGSPSAVTDTPVKSSSNRHPIRDEVISAAINTCVVMHRISFSFREETVLSVSNDLCICGHTSVFD